MGTTDPVLSYLRDLQAEKTELRNKAEAAQVTASVEYFQNESPAFSYEVLTVRTRGTPIPGLVGKSYARDYEKLGTTGADFKPPAETLSSVYARTGADIIINADGWVSDPTNPDLGMLDSLQIKDGVVYHEFMPAEYFRGTDALGFRADGSSKIYSSRFGDTAASMLADGVVDSFCFGPALVIDGVKQNLPGTQVTGRQVLGVTASGDLIIVSVDGVTNSYGCTYAQVAELGASLGMHNAIALDGGGSVQTMVNGEYTHPSTDAAERAVPCFLLIHARVVGSTGTNWKKLALVNGFTEHAAYPPGVKVKDGVVYMRGAVIHSTATAATKAADLPWWARPSSYQRFGATLASGSVLTQHYDVTTTGSLMLSVSSPNVAPRYLNVVRYPKD